MWYTFILHSCSKPNEALYYVIGISRNNFYIRFRVQGSHTCLQAWKCQMNSKIAWRGKLREYCTKSEIYSDVRDRNVKLLVDIDIT